MQSWRLAKLLEFVEPELLEKLYQYVMENREKFP